MPSAIPTTPTVTGPSPPNLPSTTIPDPTRDIQYRVLYDFEGEVASELSIKKNELVTIVLKENNGWWLARSANRLGWVPSAYVEEVTLPTPAPGTV